jgi:hypothetical protein
MSDNDTPTEPDNDPIVELRARAEALELRLTEADREAKSRLIRAELKLEAVRAGMVDLDGLKLLDLKDIKFTAEGDLENAAQLIAQLRRAKSWLFGGTSSSSPSTAPPAHPPRQKLATEMTNDEYRAARAALLRHRP